MVHRLGSFSKKHTLFFIFIGCAVIFSACKPIVNLVSTQKNQNKDQTNSEQTGLEQANLEQANREQDNSEQTPSEISETSQPLKTEYSFTATENGQIALDLIEAETESDSNSKAKSNSSTNSDSNPRPELPPLKIETIDYGLAGKFVSSINGLAGNNQNYWAFYVNGEYAQAGASQTILKKGDIITLTYEAVTFK